MSQTVHLTGCLGSYS